MCTRSRPRCGECPVSETCVARRTAREADLPARRPKKAVPQRACGVLLLKAGGAVLLEQRPATGIWGGLFSLPEMVEGETATQAALRRLGVAVADCRELPGLRHSFTHFILTLTPWLAELPVRPVMAHDPILRWVDLAELEKVGLPAPILKLLKA